MTQTANDANAGERIAAEVTSWPGVTMEPGRFGAVAFMLGRREIGHLHGEHSAHFAFPREIGTELREQGRVGPHPARPDSPGLAARQIAGPDDVADVIALLRMNYDRSVSRYGLDAPRVTGPAEER